MPCAGTVAACHGTWKARVKLRVWGVLKLLEDGALTTRTCRYLAVRVMLLVVADTVDQPVHPVPGVDVLPERTWIVTLVPDGVTTSRVKVSQATAAPASTTAEVHVEVDG